MNNNELYDAKNLLLKVKSLENLKAVREKANKRVPVGQAPQGRQLSERQSSKKVLENFNGAR